MIVWVVAGAGPLECSSGCGSGEARILPFLGPSLSNFIHTGWFHIVLRHSVYEQTALPTLGRD